MKKIKGKFTEANVYASMLDDSTVEQIETLCNQRWLEGCRIAIMPDAHVGKGATIGTTIQITTRVAPSLVGVDIGCGMSVIELGKHAGDLDLADFDRYVKENIPSGTRLNDTPTIDRTFIEQLKCFKNLRNVDKNIVRSLGTLGGGNHFVEMNEDDEGNRYIVIHSGSRNLGVQVEKHYSDLAKQGQLTINDKKREELIQHYRRIDQPMKISEALKKLEEEEHEILKERTKYMPYLVGKNFDDYMYDIEIVQKFASMNRALMLDRLEAGIRKMLNIDDSVQFNRYETIHNYVDVDEKIVRKGAISAQKGEKVIIPISMAEGSIIAYGKGNKETNFSGPHGAGRIMSRKEAREKISLKDFKETMTDIYSTSVGSSTLDEAPQAYKPLDVIIEDIKELVDVQKIIKPIYNFKAK